jgi:hypothetical protein
MFFVVPSAYQILYQIENGNFSEARDIVAGNYTQEWREYVGNFFDKGGSAIMGDQD